MSDLRDFTAKLDGDFVFADLALIPASPGSPSAIEVCDKINKVACEYAKKRGLTDQASVIEAAYVVSAYVFSLATAALCVAKACNLVQTTPHAARAAASALRHYASGAPPAQVEVLAQAFIGHCKAQPEAVLADGEAIGRKAALTLAAPEPAKPASCCRRDLSIPKLIREFADSPPPVDMPWWGWIGTGVAMAAVIASVFRSGK